MPRPLHILIVEDDRKVGALLQQGLREEGFTVEWAQDGEEGLVKALAADPALVLLDLMLPKKTGLEVVAELRARGRRTPVLMLTARDGPEDRAQSLAAGATDLLGKPFRFDELLHRIQLLVADAT